MLITVITKMIDVLKKILFLGFGGFAGSNLRYWLTRFMINITGESFPAGTLIVNVLGCFFLGISSASFSSWNLSENVKLMIGVGFLGALTTFSTFSLETIYLFQRSDPIFAVLNLLLNLIIGFSAAFLGIFIVKSCL